MNEKVIKNKISVFLENRIVFNKENKIGEWGMIAFELTKHLGIKDPKISTDIFDYIRILLKNFEASPYRAVDIDSLTKKIYDELLQYADSGHNK